MCAGLAEGQELENQNVPTPLLATDFRGQPRLSYIPTRFSRTAQPRDLSNEPSECHAVWFNVRGAETETKKEREQRESWTRQRTTKRMRKAEEEEEDEEEEERKRKNE